MREAKAYAASIYLMAGMPYLILGIAGFAFYRSVKKAERRAQAARAAGAAPPLSPGSVPT